MNKKLFENASMDDFSFLVADLENNDVNDNAPYGMTKISLIPPEHAEIDIG